MNLDFHAFAARALIAAFAVQSLVQPPVPRQPIRPASEFRPSVHGFRFVNHFTGSPLPESLRGLGQSLNLRTPSSFGLCGGMSFAAADFFLAGTPVPKRTTPPAKGTLHDFIFTRQGASLGPGFALAARFATWMALDDAAPDGTFRRTLAELPSIRERLGRGELTALGLVLARPPAVLWENHQVLAYAASESPDGVGLDIHIYDPNFPGRDDAIIRTAIRPVRSRSVPLALGFVLERPTFGLAGTRIVPGRSTTKVRGFFVMPYDAAHPPANVQEG